LLKEILEIKKNKGIAIISTHILSDLAMIADEVIMLQDGRIVSRETIKNIQTSLDDWYLNEVYKSGGMDKL
jgi:ABC-type Na+ transport system ATPase subunit NatA